MQKRFTFCELLLILLLSGVVVRCEERMRFKKLSIRKPMLYPAELRALVSISATY